MNIIDSEENKVSRYALSCEDNELDKEELWLEELFYMPLDNSNLLTTSLTTL